MDKKEKEEKLTISDIADWFMLKGKMSNKKVQKLCYYAEAWSEALYNHMITDDAVFEAWVHGPVNAELYHRFKDCGWRDVELKHPKKAKEKLNRMLTPEQTDLLESVWITYKDYSADDLEILTHREHPWLEQRKGLSKFEPCQNIISRKTMREYYRSIMIK